MAEHGTTNGRSEWTDKRLDDRFAAIDQALGLVAGLPVELRELSGAVRELRTDVTESKEAAKSVQRVLLGFFSALLIVLVGAIVGVVLAV